MNNVVKKSPFAKKLSIWNNLDFFSQFIIIGHIIFVSQSQVFDYLLNPTVHMCKAPAEGFRMLSVVDSAQKT